MSSRVRILFLCTGNSCRSQIAEGFVRHYKNDIIEAYSAGIFPRELDQNAVKVMAEMGIDISKQRPKHFDELEAINFDYVVTLCNHTYENCPVFGRKTKLIHIGFDDPSKLAMNAKNEEEALDYYRRIRDGIKNYVLGLSDNIKMSFLY